MEYNPKKILAEVKTRVAKNSAKKSLSKSFKKIFISILCTVIAGLFISILQKFNIEISALEKAEMIKGLVEIIVGGGLLGLLTLFGIDITKKRD